MKNVLVKNRHRLFLFLLILSLTFLLRLPYFSQPLDFDEGQYAFFAFFSKGEKFYSHLPIGRLPGMIFTYRALDFLFPRNIVAIRVSATLLIVLAALGIYKLGKLLFNETMGYFSAIIFILLSTQISTESPANSEFFMMPFTALAFWLFWLFQKSKRFYWLAMSGFLMGIALIYKQVAIFEASFLGLWLLVENLKVDFKISSLIKQVLVFGVLCLLPFLVLLLFFVLRGEFEVFWWQSFGSGGEYWRYAWSGFKWYSRFKTALRVFWSDFMIFWLLGLWGLKCALGKRKREEIYLVGWLGFALIGACFNGWFFLHYFIQIVPSLALLGGLTLSLFLEWDRLRWGLYVGIKKIFLIFVFLGLFFLMERKKLPGYLAYGQMLRGGINRTEYLEKIGFDVGAAGWLPFYQAADYLRTSMRKNESLFSWSSAQIFYYLTGKYPTTSFVDVYPLLDYKFMLDTGKGWKYDFENNRRKLMSELENHPPSYILLLVSPEQIFDQMVIFNSFSNFLVDHYVFDRQFGNILIYKVDRKKDVANKITFPLEVIKRFGAITNVIINEGRMEIDFEPMVNPNGVLRSFKSIYSHKEEINFFPLDLQLIEIGKEDFVGYPFIKPSGMLDLHFKVKGLPRPLSFVRVKIGNFAWNSQSYGVNPIIKVIQNNDLFDLYMEPVKVTSGEKMEIYFIYEDGSLSQTKINLD